jgi:N-carbamoyl-L-amino-acid hydrolase
MPTASQVRFARWFSELADIGRTDTGWNRVAWGPLEAEAREWFRGVAGELGLEVRQDGAGNLWAVTDDADRGPWVCAGSHLDTQPDGGAYDGALGIVCALEAAAALLEAGIERRHPLAVAAFVDEEGARFRVPCFGSQAITGVLDVDRALSVMGNAVDIYDVSRGSLRASTEQLGRVRSFMEVHVEQGRALAERGQALGVATVLSPRQRWRAEFDGDANHAGTTPMPGRRDALVEASRFVLAAQQAALTRAGAVATVGRLEVWPGSTNSIPGRAAASLDVRAPDVATVEAMVEEIRGGSPDASMTRESRNDGAQFDPGLRRRMAEAAARRGIPAGDLPSYAGHDAGMLAPRLPSAMLFVRNPTGASHTPAEFASEEDCLAAAQVLMDALEAELAG